jgi:hypothetical protein
MKGRTMAQTVSRRPLTAEARVRARSVNVKLVVDIGPGISPEFFGFPVNIIPLWPSTLASIIWEMNNRRVGGCSSET